MVLIHGTVSNGWHWTLRTNETTIQTFRQLSRNVLATTMKIQVCHVCRRSKDLESLSSHARRSRSSHCSGSHQQHQQLEYHLPHCSCHPAGRPSGLLLMLKMSAAVPDIQSLRRSPTLAVCPCCRSIDWCPASREYEIELSTPKRTAQLLTHLTQARPDRAMLYNTQQSTTHPLTCATITVHM